jgi:hypothetical protein
MATLGANVLTLADWAKRIDPNGKTPDIVEMLEETNPILADMVFQQGNLPTGHRITMRTGLPTAAWRLLNQGVQPSKSTTAQVDEQAGMLEAWSEVDKDLVELNGNSASFRLSEAKAFIEGMSQEMASTLFYGNSGLNPEEFTGLAPRFSSTTAGNAQNLILAGGSGADNTSIWLVVWGKGKVSGIFPSGSVAGLQHRDLGLQTVETTAGIAGNRMLAYRDWWQWKCGIAMEDWRYVVRIANIDVSLLVANSSPFDLTTAMIRATHLPPNLNGKACFYMNRTVFQMLDIQRYDNSATAAMTWQTIDGKLVPFFRGIPIKQCDAITEAEALVS